MGATQLAGCPDELRAERRDVLRPFPVAETPHPNEIRFAVLF
jgi:hypothetical protein